MNSMLVCFHIAIIKLKRLPLAEFWCITKEKYTELFEKVIKLLPHFPTTYLCETRFISNIRLKQVKYRSDRRIQLSSTKSNSKETCKNVKQCHFSHCIIFFVKYSYFQKDDVIYVNVGSIYSCF